MPRFHPNFPTPLEEILHVAGQLDADEQLDLQSPAEHVGQQEPEYQRALGVIALERAQQWLDVAYLCRDALADEGYVQKSRKRVVVLADSVPELRAGDA